MRSRLLDQIGLNTELRLPNGLQERFLLTTSDAASAEPRLPLTRKSLTHDERDGNSVVSSLALRGLAFLRSTTIFFSQSHHLRWPHHSHHMVSMVRYAPLNTTTKEIRLLHLPAGKGVEPIRCNLTTVSLQDSPLFEALSYVWGDPNVRVHHGRWRKLPSHDQSGKRFTRPSLPEKVASALGRRGLHQPR